MNDIDKLPGIKQCEIRPCVVCSKGVAHAGHPLFYRITIEQCGLDRGAIQRQTGLEVMLGDHALLANVMGPNEDMAKILSKKDNLWICIRCTESPHLFYQALEGYPGMMCLNNDQCQLLKNITLGFQTL
jgi:hypothetical protein